MEDLYLILGVGRDASEHDIRTAHRKWSREYHPDRGGDEAKFKEVQMAYEILSDPKRRREYDATGETGKPEDQLTALLSRAFNCFDMVVGQFVMHGSDLAMIDIVKAMLEDIADKIKETNAAIKTSKVQRKRYARMSGRFATSDSSNVFESLVERRLADMDQRIAQSESVIEEHKELCDFVKRYKYKVDSPEDFTKALDREIKEMMKKQLYGG